jgi:hypothetical protein
MANRSQKWVPARSWAKWRCLKGGVRMATLRAVTACRVAVVPGDRIDKSLLSEVEQSRRRPCSD